MNQKYNFIQPLILSILLAGGMLIGYGIHKSDDKLIEKIDNSDYQQTTEIDQVLRLIQDNYLFEPKMNQLSDDVLKSIADDLDPFSMYIPASDYQQNQDNLNASYYGLGLTIHKFRDTLVVVSVIHKSPAAKSGIRPLDKLLKINDKPLMGRSDEFIASEFGKIKDIPLNLTIKDRSDNVKTVQLRNSQIETQTLDKVKLISDSILYVSINQFSNHTYSELLSSIEKYAVNEHLSNLIIDLRENPGGFLQEVMKILDQFFDKSELLFLQTVYKDGRKDVIKSSGRNFYQIDNIYVIINEQSASGSEILAGVLQDQDRGIVIGKQSFGKGLVQDQYDLFNGGALRLTIADYFLPSGRNIQKKLSLKDGKNYSFKYNRIDTFFSIKYKRPVLSGTGVTPDIFVEDTLYDKVNRFVSTHYDTITNLSLDFALRNKYLFGKNLNFLRDSDVMIKDDSISRFLSLFPPQYSTYLLQKLEAKVASLIYGEDAETNLLLSYDPYIRQALKLPKFRLKKSGKLLSLK